MAQQRQGPSGPPPNPAGRRSNTLWWVLIGVAAAALVVVVVWMVSRASGPDTPDPEPTVSTSTAPTKTSTPPEPTEPGPEPSDEWGGFPPANPDARRDLRDPEFPDAVGAFALTEATPGIAGVTAFYEDPEVGSSFMADVTYALDGYALQIEGLDDVGYIGDAVCGTSVSETGRQSRDCLMVGEAELLWVSSFSEEVTLEDVAELTQEFYDQL